MYMHAKMLHGFHPLNLSQAFPLPISDIFDSLTGQQAEPDASQTVCLSDQTVTYASWVITSF